MAGNPDIPESLKTGAGIIWRLLLFVGAIALIMWTLLSPLFAITFAMFFALLITAWASPLMNLLNRWIPKAIAMVISLFTIIALVVVILTVVATSTISEGPKVVSSAKAGLQQIESWLKSGPLRLSDDQVSSLLSSAQNAAETVGKGLLGEFVGVLSSVGTLIIAGSVFIFAVITFMLSGKSVYAWLMSWIPKRVRTKTTVAGEIAWDSIAGYSRGIVIVAFADATLVFIGLLILQVPLAPALAALVFLGAFIPIVGAPIATLFAAVVALAERGLVVALLTVVLTVIVGSFDGDVLQPLVMGKAVNLAPLAIVLSIAIGSIVLGIIGALIAVPIAGAIYGVMKYLSGRDPNRPPEGASPPTPAPAPAPAAA
jgi:predicted PurR-regulated permease PerM